MENEQLLNLDEWSIICSIRQEPKYRFLGSELTRAKKLEERGLIQSIGNKMFVVTTRGENLFNKGPK